MLGGYVVARGKGGRASLQHRLTQQYGNYTACGRDTSEWSRAYLPTPIEPIYCLICKRGRKEP